MRIFWCEQSGIIEDRSNFYSDLASVGIEIRRLNWRWNQDDPLANVSCPKQGVSWSKGRETLFNSVKDEMNSDDYVVLADDDIQIIGGRQGLKHLRDSLTKIRPPLAVPYSTNKHHFSTGMEYKKHKNPEKPFPIFLVDLQVQVFRKDFADIIFPCLYDGGYGTYWYAYFFCALKYGYGALCLPQFRVNNLRHDNPHGDYGGLTNNASDNIWRDSEVLFPARIKKWYTELGNREVTVRVANSWYALRPTWLLRGSFRAERKIARFRAKNQGLVVNKDLCQT